MLVRRNMKVTNIPFVEHIGIEKKDNTILKLDFQPEVHNHLGDIHASAQFTLAETQSGLYLQTKFPQYEGKVVALLRDSTVKFRHPAKMNITAHAFIDEEVEQKFLTLLEKRGKATIAINVEVKDAKEVVTMQGYFNWFIIKTQ